MTTASARIVRSAARLGGQRSRLRKELRALDDVALLKRLARYTGRTMSEERRQHRPSWGTNAKAIDRESVMDLIVHIEVPSP